MNIYLKRMFNFLDSNHVTPTNIEITQIANMFFVSSYNFLNSAYVSESIASGASYHKEIALLKSLTEYIERMISKDVSEQFKILGICRSDGYAAFPNYYEDLSALEKCRNNAFHEAFERYCWANWWDNPVFSFTYCEDLHTTSKENTIFHSFLMKKFDLERLIYISPTTNLDPQSKVCIIFAKIRNLGYVTGGAADFSGKINSMVARAFSELTRHLLGFDRMKDSINRNFSFYESRLFNFASGENNLLVEQRLNNPGKGKIILPNLIFDNSFDHRFIDDFALHRCLFKDQPIFIGGEVNRLCL